MNKAILSGNVGKEPQLKYTNSGKAVLSFSMATKDKFNDKEITGWHNIVVWGPRAEKAGQLLKKGDRVFVEGRITNRSWDDKDGNKRYTTEIVAESIDYLNKGSSVEADQTEQQPITDDLPF